MLYTISDSLKPASEGAIERLEARIGGPLPRDYRVFLGRYNGGRVEPARFAIHWKGQPWAKRFPYASVHFLFGFQEGSSLDLDDNLESYQERLPKDLLPIGSDPGGNLILLGLRGDIEGRVFYWVRDYEADEGETPNFSNVGEAGASFASFLDSLYAESQ